MLHSVSCARRVPAAAGPFLPQAGGEQPAIVDPVANRVRSMGEGVPTGRADDFRWPRGAINTEPNAPSAAAKK